MRIPCLLIAVALTGCILDDEEDATAAIEQDAQFHPFLDGFFPIAADYQPHGDFDKWKNRGANTVVRVPGADNVGDWSHKAKDLGLRMIREPAAHPGDDKNEPLLLAWHWRDEPELHGDSVSSLVDFRHRMHDVDPDRPIITNFWGGGMRQANSNGCFNGHCYPSYIDHNDWVSDDIYPCNKFDCNIEVVGQEVSRLRRWGDNKPSFAYIETGDFDGNGTGPSPRRFKAEIWDAIIHGARGVFYFSARIKQNCSDHCLASYDMTEPDVADEMRSTSALIERLAPVLQRAINPHGVEMQSGDDSLEIGWRYSPDAKAFFFFVLNPNDSHKDHRRLELHGFKPRRAVKVIDEGREEAVHMTNKVIVDNFDPYELHIYKVEVQ